MDVGVRSEWKVGWPLVLASVIGTSTSSISFYSVGVMMAPLQQQFGWTRAEVTSGLLINSVISVLLAPFAGRLIDRFGPRLICLPGIVLFCLAFAALATVNGNLWQWRALWVFISITALMLMPTAFTAAVASRFDRSRGTALAITLCGTGLAGVLVPAVTAIMLEQFEWRTAYYGVALLWFTAAFPLCFLFFRDANDVRRMAPSYEHQSAPAELTGHGAMEGLLSATFLKLAGACFLLMLVVGSMIVHMVPFLRGAGLDPIAAASLASVIGATNIFGRISTGFALDRLSAPVVGAVAFGAPAVLMAFALNYDGSAVMGVVLATLLGLSGGALLQIAAYMASRYLGMKNYGLLFGAIIGLLGLAVGIGPMLMAAVFDHFGSYRLAFIVAIPLSLTASLLVLSLRREEGRLSAPAAAAA